MRTSIFLLCLLFLISSCSEKRDKNPPPNSKEVKIALDWRPNVLHAPIFIAQERGYFEDANLKVEWISPEVDDYSKKPIDRLLDGEVDLSIHPSEHLFFYCLDTNGQPLARAQATLLQEGKSVFVAKSAPDIDGPGDWDGMTYHGYGTPLEKTILTEMIKNDGGTGSFHVQKPKKFKVWPEFLKNEKGIAWVFGHWEVIHGQTRGYDLEAFSPEEYGIPYGYSSVISARTYESADYYDRIKTFFKVLKRTTEEMLSENNLQLAIELCETLDHPNFKEPHLIEKCLDDILPSMVSDGANWGKMKPRVWGNYYDWIQKNELRGGEKISKTRIEDWWSNHLLQ